MTASPICAVTSPPWSSYSESTAQHSAHRFSKQHTAYWTVQRIHRWNPAKRSLLVRCIYLFISLFPQKVSSNLIPTLFKPKTFFNEVWTLHIWVNTTCTCSITYLMVEENSTMSGNQDNFEQGLSLPVFLAAGADYAMWPMKMESEHLYNVPVQIRCGFSVTNKGWSPQQLRIRPQNQQNTFCLLLQIA